MNGANRLDLHHELLLLALKNEEGVPEFGSNYSYGLAGAMLAIVSEKTGYPVEMLELEMDMEADLGIDSIKRVEILAAVPEGQLVGAGAGRQPRKPKPQ